MRRSRPTAPPSSGTFAGAFREALEARGMTLAALQNRLAAHGNPVSRTALGYWRTGERNPEGAASLAAVADIESILGLTDGALLRRLGQSRRTGVVDPPRVVGEDHVRAAIEETVAVLGVEGNITLRDLSTHIVADVDDSGAVRTLRNQAVLQCVTGTLFAFPYFELATAPTDIMPEFTAITGCRLTAQARHPDGEVFGFVLELDRPLEPAATAVVEWSLTFPLGYPPARLVEHAVFRRSRDLLLIVRYPDNAVPRWCEEFEDDADGHPVLTRTIEPDRTAHVTRTSFGPGRVGIAWGYED